MKTTCILAVGAALLGLAQAFYPDSAIDSAVNMAFKALETMTPYQVLTVGGQYHHRQEERDREHCELCMMGTVRHIMDSVIDHFKELCASTQCPYLKKKCAQAKEHPMIAYGFLLDHVHAHEKAAAYCYGRGVCPHPGSGHCCCGTHCSLESPAGDDFERVVDMMGLSSMEKVMPLLPIAGNEETNQTCVQCIEGTACCIMDGVVKMAKEYCEKAECPCIKRRCEWAMKHKGIVLGILIHRVRPGEWGCGYCFGKGICKFPNTTEAFDYSKVILRAQNAW